MREKCTVIRIHMNEDRLSEIRELALLSIPKYNKNGSNKTELSKEERVNTLNDQIKMFFKMAYPPRS